LSADVCAHIVDIDNGRYESAVNVSERVSSSVTLPCTINGSVSICWLYIHFDTAQQSKIYGNGQLTNNLAGKFRAVADPATGNYSLILFNAQMNDSGWYVCVSESRRIITNRHIISLLVSGE
jgi:Immunoglobulin V-set domain